MSDYQLPKDYIKNKLDYKVINRGKCMICGKELTEGLFFCKECEQKGGLKMKGDMNTEHGCSDCKYLDKKLSEEPCDSCDIRLGNPKWEEADDLQTKEVQ